MKPTGLSTSTLLPSGGIGPSSELARRRIAVLGRKQGVLTFALRALPTFTSDERKKFGGEANRLKEAFEAAFAEREAALTALSAPSALTFDLSMPGRGRWIGALHPVTLVMDELIGIFRELGFAVAVGPEAEPVYKLRRAHFRPTPLYGHADPLPDSEGADLCCSDPHPGADPGDASARRLSVVIPCMVYRTIPGSTHARPLRTLGLAVARDVSSTSRPPFPLGPPVLFWPRQSSLPPLLPSRASGARRRFDLSLKGVPPASRPLDELIGCGMVHPTG